MMTTRTLTLVEHCQYCGARLLPGREVLESGQARYADSVFCDKICLYGQIAFDPESDGCIFEPLAEAAGTMTRGGRGAQSRARRPGAIQMQRPHTHN